MSTRATIASEADVLDAVLDYLTAVRVTAFRTNTGAMKIANRFVRFGVPGNADIYALPIIRGTVSGIPVCWTTALFVEVKSATGRQSAEQRSFEKQVTSAGAYYAVVRTVDDMASWLREHGAIL